MNEQRKRELRSKRATQEERRMRALELRKEGLSYREIGDHLCISDVSAWRLVQRALEKQAKLAEATAQELLTLELERLDAMHHAIWEKAEQGDLRAIDRLLKIMEHRARLLHLDEARTAAQDVPRIEIVCLDQAED